MTFADFKVHMTTLHEMEIASDKCSTEEGNGTMYNCQRQLDDKVFAYSYDALCTEVLRFNEDGSVSEWCDALDTDHENYEPHFNHASVEEWMKAQIVAIQFSDA